MSNAGSEPTQMREDMTIDDAINVVNVAHDCLPHDADRDVRQLAIAARRLVREDLEQAHELERERARRRATAGPEACLVDGHPLVEGQDGGGRRDFLAGRPVHAGDTPYLLTFRGWHAVRYESNMARGTPVLYLSIPGVEEDVVFAVPRSARFAWSLDPPTRVNA